jgi:hypothetical protein
MMDYETLLTIAVVCACFPIALVSGMAVVLAYAALSQDSSIKE